LPDIIGQTSLSLFQDNVRVILNFFQKIEKLKVKVVGTEKIFGTLFNKIGFNAIEDDLFRHLVVTRLVYPGSKLKTIDYLRRNNGVEIDINKIYRFLDRLHSQYKEHVE
jgi:hypothetical protein